MPEKAMTIQKAVIAFPREEYGKLVTETDEEREQILGRFPLEQWPSMPLEKYAIGQEGVSDTFCQWMEFKSLSLGSIKGGSARKLIIYKRRKKPGWYFDSKKYGNEQDAWNAVREGFVEAFRLAEQGDLYAIDEIEALNAGPALRTKAVYTYFPDKILPVYSRDHLRHFLRQLGKPEAEEKALDVLRLNTALLQALREFPELEGWSHRELMLLLYKWADPREAKRVVKIAPGEAAKFWQHCLRDGYICVGWDDVGDLREFDSKDDFLAAFTEAYRATYNDHQQTISKKANEVWTLAELEAGDIVVANKGTSHALAVGEVVEPGYEWRPERDEYKHTVRMKWDTSYAQDIQPQKRWAFVTVAKVAQSLYQRILSKKGEAPAKKLAPATVDPVFSDIAGALDRKGQAILYGPPGTGKTYAGLRFSVWWLLRELGEANPESVLADDETLRRAERRLSSGHGFRRVWWVVANPREWSWDQLFADGSVDYRYGKLGRNYPLVQDGDLVVGYQATPDKRIAALAKVKRKLHTTAEGEKKITLEPLAKVNDGHTYDELTGDPVLSLSEPIRMHNQGTLFALTDDEAEELMAGMIERDPQLRRRIGAGVTCGHLTRLTFHPSYSYEDFIEGFRPVDAGGGTLSLRLEDGVFKRVCREAESDSEKPYLVFIDEINRANIAKVFGELITLLERDKRGVVVTLPQSKQPFAIPPNVYLLGTMNTADRSIKLLDAALRRRFSFLELMPDSELLRGATVGNLALDEFLDELNRRIAKRAGREKQIGHSFLLEGDSPVTDASEFARRFRQEILPLLQEYCYDDYSVLAEYVGGTLVDADAQVLDQERVNDPDRLLEALEEEFGQTRGEQ